MLYVTDWVRFISFDLIFLFILLYPVLLARWAPVDACDTRGSYACFEYWYRGTEPNKKLKKYVVMDISKWKPYVVFSISCAYLIILNIADSCELCPGSGLLVVGVKYVALQAQSRMTERQGRRRDVLEGQINQSSSVQVAIQ